MTKIQEYLKLKVEDRPKWILKNIYPYSTMKPRKTKNGFNLTPRNGVKWMVEFADGNNHLYPDDFETEDKNDLGRVIDFPQAFFVYDKKYGTPIREVWMEDLIGDFIVQHFRGY